MEPEQSTKINFSSTSFRKYFKNTSWLFAEKIFRLLLGFFVNVIVIRYLGPEKFGTISYSLSLVGLFTAIASLGLESIIAREIVTAPENKNEILGSVFGLRIIGGITASILLTLTLIFSDDNYETKLLIAVIGLSLITQAFIVIEFYFQSQVKAKLTSTVQMTNIVITSIFRLIMIYFHASLFWFAFSYLLESLVLAIGFSILYSSQGLKLKDWAFNKTRATSLIKDSWPLIFSGVVIAVYLKVDQILIKKMMSEEATGLYASAVRLCEAWYFIPMAVSASLFPAILSGKNLGEEHYLSRLQKLYDILAWIAIGIALPVTFLSTDIMRILFGVKFIPAATSLTIYIWAGVPTFLGVASSQYLIAENYTKMSFYRTLAGMIMNVILNLILIPIYGINGSAIATLISYSIATFSIGASRKTFFQLWMMIKAILFIDLFIFTHKLWQKNSQPK